MELDAVVRGRLEFIAVEVTHDSSLPPSADRLLAGMTTGEYFNVDDVMFLRLQLCVKIRTAVKDQVSWLHLFKFQIDWKCIVLISLIPAIQFESKVFLHVKHSLPDKSTAVQENWRIEMLLAFLPVAFGIWHPEVLLDRFKPLFSQVLFEGGVLAVHRRLARDVVAILDFFLLCSAKVLEVGLQALAAWLDLTKAQKHWFLVIFNVFFVGGITLRLHEV